MNKTFNLQRFAEPAHGKNTLYLIRRLVRAAEEAAKILAFQKEGGRSVSKDADTVVTKDGTLRIPGASEIEITLTMLMLKDSNTYDDLEDAMHADETFEIWEAHMDEKGTDTNSGKYKSIYYQGNLTSLEITANAEDYIEVSLTFGIIGTGKRGYCTVDRETAEAAGYEFADTTQAAA